MIGAKAIALCVCPVLLAPPAVLATNPTARHWTAGKLHSAARHLDGTKPHHTPTPSYASLPCHDVLAGTPYRGFVPTDGSTSMQLAMNTPAPIQYVSPFGSLDNDGPNQVIVTHGGGGGGSPGVPGSPPVTSLTPEPSTWAQLIVGFGFVGGLQRKMRRWSI